MLIKYACLQMQLYMKLENEWDINLLLVQWDARQTYKIQDHFHSFEKNAVLISTRFKKSYAHQIVSSRNPHKQLLCSEKCYKDD